MNRHNIHNIETSGTKTLMLAIALAIDFDQKDSQQVVESLHKLARNAHNGKIDESLFLNALQAQPVLLHYCSQAQLLLSNPEPTHLNRTMDTCSHEDLASVLISTSPCPMAVYWFLNSFQAGVGSKHHNDAVEAIALQPLYPYQFPSNRRWVNVRKRWIKDAKGQGFTGEQWELTRNHLLSLLEGGYPSLAPTFSVEVS